MEWSEGPGRGELKGVRGLGGERGRESESVTGRSISRGPFSGGLWDGVCIAPAEGFILCDSGVVRQRGVVMWHVVVV